MTEKRKEFDLFNIPYGCVNFGFPVHVYSPAHLSIPYIYSRLNVTTKVATCSSLPCLGTAIILVSLRPALFWAIRNYNYSLPNSTEERSSHLLRGAY
jgi:hypothetical protein